MRRKKRDKNEGLIDANFLKETVEKTVSVAALFLLYFLFDPR